MRTRGSKSDVRGRMVERSSENWLWVLGDLHLEPGQMSLFHESRDEIVRQLRDDASGALLPNARLVQLGDVGGYSSQPGSAACFERAIAYLDSYGVPRHSVLGNHDLEGWEFETDAENLDMWRRKFGQHHFWAEDLGHTLLIGLSTVRFRDAPDSNHEVRWFEKTLAENADKKAVFVFTHAPPMGSGLTCLQMSMCQWDAQVRLQCAGFCPEFVCIISTGGHYHLSHDYKGSICRNGRCLFVQTGVMGNCHRDGRRHSRVLKGDAHGYQLYTLEHGTGEMRLDVRHLYADEPDTPPVRVWCSNLSSGGAFSPVMPQDLHPEPDQMPPSVPCHAEWLQSGDLILAINANQLIQYDRFTRAPIGVVCEAINGRDVDFITSEGSDFVEAIELKPTLRSKNFKRRGRFKGGVEFERIDRNEVGGFWQIYQINKWHIRRAEKLKEGQLAAASAAAV
eukprot:jgi/Mesen1/10943/ME000956S10323